MLVNSSLTVYHLSKELDEQTRMPKWIRYNYDNVWWFGGKGAGTNAGYNDANDVQVRIFYALNKNLEYTNFKIGDILVQDNLNFDIQSQQDLSKYEVYNITALNNNNFGNNPHIHIGGK